MDPNIIALIISISYRMNTIWLMGSLIRLVTIFLSIILDDIVNMVNVDGMVNHIPIISSIIPSTIYVMT